MDHSEGGRSPSSPTDKAETISFGRPYIANPDLVERMRKSWPLADANMDFAYVGDARGYVDYPGFAEGT